MKEDPDHYSTDSAKIEALITRIERGQLCDGDARSLARLLRLLLRLITLLQQKHGVLAVRHRDWEPPFAYSPLMSHIFFTGALNEIGDSI